MVVQENGKRSIENGQKMFMNLQSAQIVMVCPLLKNFKIFLIMEMIETLGSHLLCFLFYFFNLFFQKN